MGFSPVINSIFTTNQAHLDKVAQSTSHCQKGFDGGLFQVHSPLLSESLVISFPSLIDMLKFRELFCITQMKCLFNIVSSMFYYHIYQFLQLLAYSCHQNACTVKTQCSNLCKYRYNHTEQYITKLRRAMSQLAFEKLMQIFTIRKNITHVESFFFRALPK